MRRGHQRLAPFEKSIFGIFKLSFGELAGASSWWSAFAKFGNTPLMMGGWEKSESRRYMCTFVVTFVFQDGLTPGGLWK